MAPLARFFFRRFFCRGNVLEIAQQPPRPPTPPARPKKIGPSLIAELLCPNISQNVPSPIMWLISYNRGNALRESIAANREATAQPVVIRVISQQRSVA